MKKKDLGTIVLVPASDHSDAGVITIDDVGIKMMIIMHNQL
jgi:hypothetical protein